MTGHAKAEGVLRTASGQESPSEALSWFSEGHPILGDYSAQDVMAALIEVSSELPVADEAMKKVAAIAATSGIDPGAVLFDIEAITDPESDREKLLGVK